MELQPWPEAHDCAACVSLQFGSLSMRLPSALIGQVFVSATAIAQLHIIPAGADIKTSLFFHVLPSAQITEKYQSLVRLPLDPQLFFDRLGAPALNPDPWSKIRTVEQLDTALRYTKTSKGPLHVYWIRGRQTNSHYLYFVIDGSPLVYAAFGELTPEFFNAILAHLVITPEP
ncbi:hypothetical protein [Duganella aceris]|uniref:Uncharacterized protein n=1 Tax=Duganella aceris TaxID=2703883 RepID=A0ABX0FTQ7_9BURK|nr:hypothetical protein [Duganella aceris]NGZ87780.1 hypothetical protein [Duganella aceris]